jgi:hypothetical protein
MRTVRFVVSILGTHVFYNYNFSWFTIAKTSDVFFHELCRGKPNPCDAVRAIPTAAPSISGISDENRR